MTSNPYRNAAQEPEVMARNAKDQQQASPEAIERYRRSFSELHEVPSWTPDMPFYQSPYRDYERPKFKFILTAVRSVCELAAVVGGLAAIVGVLIVLTAMA
jgi:hypothetical protein